MSQDVEGEVAGILGQRIVATAQEGQGPCREHHIDGRARASAEGDQAPEIRQAEQPRLAGGAGDPNGILNDSRVDIDRIGSLLQAQ